MSSHNLKKQLEEITAGQSNAPVDFGNDGIKADVIAESTSATGVTIDGVVCQDSSVQADVFALNTSGALYLSSGALSATGNSTSGAAPITEVFTRVTGADNTKAVMLPSAEPGLTYIVVNTSTDKTLPLVPYTGDKINGGAANSAITMAAASACVCVAFDSTDWYTIPKTPG